MANVFSLAQAVKVLRVNGHAPGRELLRYHAARGHVVPDEIRRNEAGQVLGYTFTIRTLRLFAAWAGWQYVGPDSSTPLERP